MQRNSIVGGLNNARLRTILFTLSAIACLLLSPRIAQGQTQLVSTPTYTVLLSTQFTVPSLLLESEGSQIFRFPVASGLSNQESEENLSDIVLEPIERVGEAQVLTVRAKSSLWVERRFVWKFFADHIEYQQFASGAGNIQRCYFFSNGTSGNTRGVNGNTTVYADKYFSPRANLADLYEYPIGIPQSVGVASEKPHGGDYDSLLMGRLFTPAPLMLSYRRDRVWASIGIGTEPGKYQFNALEYSGSLYAGASWWVNYQGRQAVTSQEFSSPVAAIHFAHDPLDSLREYVNWIDVMKFGTQHTAIDAKWHHLPMYCGWAEQTVLAKAVGEAPRDYATQANYEAWIKTLESRSIPIGTVSIDDKWQKEYGTFEVDETKWPDLKGFVQRQHALGRHVILWVPVLQKDGVPEDLTIKINGKAVAADITNPNFERLIRGEIRHLIVDIGIDGFKEDWISGLPDFSATDQAAPIYGIELVRRFEWVVYDETHKWKPDAFVETHSPNPLFRESADVIRLNDLWYGSRNLPQTMFHRAQIAWIAGWQLVDTDNGGQATLEEWHQYFRYAPQLGIPALYFVSKTESTREVVPDRMWKELAEIWNTYVERVNHEFK